LDLIEKIDGSVIQHGPHNDRIYLMRMGKGDAMDVVARLDAMAKRNGYGKIFAKVPAWVWDTFKSAGYLKEAIIPGFFSGKTDGLFIAKFLAPERQISKTDEKAFRSIKTTDLGPAESSKLTGETEYPVESIRSEDAKEISGIYRNNFKTYPFPIHDPVFVKQMLDQGVRYYGIRIKGRLVAVAAIELDRKEKNAEMTDFATLPQWQGCGFAGRLLRHMASEARKIGIITAYTIARADSLGMNLVFKKNGFCFAGLLKNNSQIGGGIKDMTVWYRDLRLLILAQYDS